MSEQLKLHRDQIDAIDEQILKLVNERAALARQIGSLKDDGVIYRPEREAQVLRRLQANNNGPLSNEAVSNIFRAVMSNCRALEKELAIAFLGPLGTYSAVSYTHLDVYKRQIYRRFRKRCTRCFGLYLNS